MSSIKGRVVAVVAVVGAIGFGTAGVANARIAPELAAAAVSPANSCNTACIVDGQVYQSDLNDGVEAYLRQTPANSVWTSSLNNSVVTEAKLYPAVRAKLNSTTGQVTGLEADGPYPGSTKLQDFPGNGANSTEKVPADGNSHAVWVECADGKTALGGGYRVGADQGDAVASKIQVTASEPTQIKDGAVVYTPIAGDAAGSIEPNGWLVEVINSGTVDATVRPWVTCAKVAK